MRDESERVTGVGTIVREREVFEHPHFPVISRVIKTPNGDVREPQFLWDRWGKEFAVAVAVDVDGHFILVEEPKYGQMRNFLSCATGGVKKKNGETPLEAAKRELLEETGYESRKWISIHNGTMVDFPDKTDGGEHHFFLAMNVRKIGEPETFRSVVKITRAQIERMLIGEEVKGHRIEIAMTHVALNCALRHMAT